MNRRTCASITGSPHPQVLPVERDPMEPPAYRIEHWRDEDAELILAFRDHARYPQLLLAQFADALLANGETGVLLLIDQATEDVVARRHLLPWMCKRQ